MRPCTLPRPVGTRGAEYLFDVPGGGVVGFTFVALASGRTLTRICGGDERFLRDSFPDRIVPVCINGETRQMKIGIAVLPAARWFASLCIDAQQKRLAALNVAQPAPGPIDRLIAALRAWRPRRGVGALP